MSQIDEILERLVLVHSWHDSDKEDTLRHAKTKLKSILLSEAVEVTPVMYRNPINGGMVVGVTNSAIPIEAVNRLFDD